MKKDKKRPKKSSSKRLIWLAIAGALSCFVVLGLYIFHFPGGFSSDPGRWGAFGDFFGGALNPLLSFLALLALIYTIWQQQEEIEETRAEMEASRIAQELTAKAQQEQLERMRCEERKEDLLRIVDAIYREIVNETLPAETDVAVNAPIIKYVPVAWFVGEGKRQSFYDALNYALRLRGTGEEVVDPHLDALPLLQRLRQQLVELGAFLDAFDELARDERMITDYYRRRLWPIVRDLTHLFIMEPPEDALFHDASMRGSGRQLRSDTASS